MQFLQISRVIPIFEVFFQLQVSTSKMEVIKCHNLLSNTWQMNEIAIKVCKCTKNIALKLKISSE